MRKSQKRIRDETELELRQMFQGRIDEAVNENTTLKTKLKSVEYFRQEAIKSLCDLAKANSIIAESITKALMSERNQL